MGRWFSRLRVPAAFQSGRGMPLHHTPSSYLQPIFYHTSITARILKDQQPTDYYAILLSGVLRDEVR